MADAAVTMATATVHNPSEPRHFMRLKPLSRRVRVMRGDVLLADTTSALLLLEVGKDFYDPVYYIPEADVRGRLVRNDRITHCPLKGDARYFDLLSEDDGVRQNNGVSEDDGGRLQNIAWSYQEPLAIAPELAGRIAFDRETVTVEDAPAPG